MPEIEIEFDVICEVCGEELQADVEQGRFGVKVEVMPCQKCIESAREEERGFQCHRTKGEAERQDSRS